MKIARLSSCKNFVSEREKFIFDAFVAFCHTAGKKEVYDLGEFCQGC